MIHQRVWSAIVILALAVVSVAGSVVLSQDRGKPDPGKPDQAGQPDKLTPEMIEKWKTIMEPGAAHRELEFFAGNWEVTIVDYCHGPEPVRTNGRAESQLILGGRFVHESFKGTVRLPDANGNLKDKQFEGRSVVGYDNYRKSYQMVWIDNLSTSVFTVSGQKLTGVALNLDEQPGRGQPDRNAQPGRGQPDRGMQARGSQAIYDLYGTVDNALVGAIAQPIRHRIQVLDDNRFICTMYDLSRGPNVKMMEFTYQRAVDGSE